MNEKIEEFIKGLSDDEKLYLLNSIIISESNRIDFYGIRWEKVRKAIEEYKQNHPIK